MDVSSIGVQQAAYQTKATTALIRQNAEAEQALANALTQAAATNGRGQIVDVTA